MFYFILILIFKFKAVANHFVSSFRFSCKSCGKSFGRNEHLKGHILRIHLQITSLKCFKCSEEFAGKYELKRHLKMFHQKKPIRRKNAEATTDLVTSADSTRWNFCDCFIALILFLIEDTLARYQYSQKVSISSTFYVRFFRTKFWRQSQNVTRKAAKM